jgi:hypothetical protein
MTVVTSVVMTVVASKDCLPSAGASVDGEMSTAEKPLFSGNVGSVKMI